MRVEDLDRWADARMEYHRARYRALWGPHAPAPLSATENIATVKTLEEIAEAACSTPCNRPICDGGPNALCVEYRGVTFWVSLKNRRYPEKEAVQMGGGSK